MLKREEIMKKYGKIPFFSPYEKIFALIDDEKKSIELHEYHARGVCNGGAAWEVYHFQRTSRIIKEAFREGARNVFILSTGEEPLDLIPGMAGAGLESANIKKDIIELTYAGLAGGGVAVTVCRGMAKNIEGMDIISMGGGAKLGKARLHLPAYKKLVFGADDTDIPGKGATWSIMNEIGYNAEKEGVCHYLDHTITQLYPHAPHKTTNCVSISLNLACPLGKEKEVKKYLIEKLEECTYSQEASAVFYEKIDIPQNLKRYTQNTKNRIVEIEEAEKAAKNNNVEVIEVTGPMGKIGAVASIGLHRNREKAVMPYY
ncbi:MAG: methanogenesis marker protein 11 [Candidatus Methanofastidiosia archaeon]